MIRQMNAIDLEKELELEARAEREIRETILNSKAEIYARNITCNIKNYIKNKGMNIEDFARESFVSRSSMTNLFKGRLNVSLKHLLGFCGTMNCTLNDIVEKNKKI